MDTDCSPLNDRLETELTPETEKEVDVKPAEVDLEKPLPTTDRALIEPVKAFDLQKDLEVGLRKS